MIIGMNNDKLYEHILFYNSIIEYFNRHNYFRSGMKMDKIDGNLIKRYMEKKEEGKKKSKELTIVDLIIILDERMKIFNEFNSLGMKLYKVPFKITPVFMGKNKAINLKIDFGIKKERK